MSTKEPAEKIKGMPIHSKSQNIDKEKLIRFLPKGASHKVSDKIIEIINNIEYDTGLNQEYMEEKILANMTIVKDLKLSLEEYVNVIKYCTLKQNLTNRKAWEIVFPDRLKRLEDLIEQRKKEGKPETVNINSHVSNFNKTEAVLRIDAQMALAVSIEYAPYRQMAIMKLVNLTNGIASNPNTRVSAHVEHLSAAKLYDITKVPEDNTFKVEMGMSEKAIEVQKGLMKEVARMADAQFKAAESGMKLDDVQKLSLGSDVVDVDIE